VWQHQGGPSDCCGTVLRLWNGFCQKLGLKGRVLRIVFGYWLNVFGYWLNFSRPSGHIVKFIFTSIIQPTCAFMTCKAIYYYIIIIYLLVGKESLREFSRVGVVNNTGKVTFNCGDQDGRSAE